MNKKTEMAGEEVTGHFRLIMILHIQKKMRSSDLAGSHKIETKVSLNYELKKKHRL